MGVEGCREVAGGYRGVPLDYKRPGGIGRKWVGAKTFCEVVEGCDGSQVSVEGFYVVVRGLAGGIGHDGVVGDHRGVPHCCKRHRQVRTAAGCYRMVVR